MNNNYSKSVIRRTSSLLYRMAFLLLLVMLSNQSVTGASFVPYTTNGAGVQGDDTYANQSLTTTFPYGININGTTYTSLYVGSNGYITFGQGYSSYSPTGIAGFRLCPMIAGQYSDLYPGKGGQGSVYYSQYSDY